VRHLVTCGEILGLRLLTIHNVYALNRFMADMRAAIADGTFTEWKEQVRKETTTDE
jgi:queuine tRNA-ribosyltransferase